MLHMLLNQNPKVFYFTRSLSLCEPICPTPTSSLNLAFFHVKWLQLLPWVYLRNHTLAKLQELSSSTLLLQWLISSPTHCSTCLEEQILRLVHLPSPLPSTATALFTFAFSNKKAPPASLTINNMTDTILQQCIDVLAAFAFPVF